MSPALYQNIHSQLELCVMLLFSTIHSSLQIQSVVNFIPHKIINSSVLIFRQNFGPAMCAQACTRTTGCNAVNYRKDYFFCELFEVSSSLEKNVDNEFYSYSQKAGWIFPEDTCAPVKCEEGQFCVIAYNDIPVCVKFAKQLNKEEEQLLFQMQDTWKLIFRGTAGIGVKTYPAYLGSIKLSTPEVGCYLTESAICTTHYRNSIIDSWQFENIKQVRFALFKDGNMVVNLIFRNLVGDSNVRWFHKDRLISSSFTDLTDPGQSFNYFGIQGDTGAERRFYINQLYNSCPNDRGWMAVYDEAPICDFEKGHVLPHFAYMPQNKVWLWSGDYQSADVLAIFVKKDDN